MKVQEGQAEIPSSPSSLGTLVLSSLEALTKDIQRKGYQCCSFDSFFSKIKHMLEENLPSLCRISRRLAACAFSKREVQDLGSEGGSAKCHSCPLCSQHPPSPGCLVHISLLPENAAQLLLRRHLYHLRCRYRPDTQRSRRRQSRNAQGILYSSSWHFWVAAFKTSFSSHRSLENFLATPRKARATPTLPLVCPSLSGSKWLGGEDFS